MLGNIILIGLIFACIVVIIVIILRKFPKLSGIDLSSLPEEKQAEMKNKIISARFTRRTTERINSFLKFLRPVWIKFQKGFRRLYQKAVELERKYRKKHHPVVTKKDLEKNIEELLKKANEFLQEEKFASAEKQYIEIISLDNKNLSAYNGLGQLYFQQKDFGKAKEIFEYIIKIHNVNKKTIESFLDRMKENDDKDGIEKEQHKLSTLERDLANTYIDLGLVEKSLGENDNAFKTFLNAVDLVPNHPRYLDLLLESSIILNKKPTAVQVFEKLKQVNPENQKLDELSEKIKEIPDL